MASPPNLSDTPYKYHVYLVFACTEDQTIADQLAQQLRESGFFVFENNEDDNLNENIENGIENSRKVVFIITKNYLQYKMRTRQIQLANERARCISDDDIIVLKDRDITEDQIRKEGLGRYRCLDLSGDMTCIMCHIQDSSVVQLKAPQNMGVAMAYSHYYGYLRIILPELKERARRSGLMKGIVAEGTPDKKLNLNNRNMSEKLYIIIPESLKGVPDLCDLDQSISSRGKIPLEAARGGHDHRDYSTPVFSIKNPGSEDLEELLFMAEIPSILINIYDMKMHGIQIDKGKIRLELQQFLFHLDSLLRNDAGCAGKYTFIYHRDQETSGYQPIGDKILQKIQAEVFSESWQETQDDGGNVDDVERLDIETLRIHDPQIFSLKCRQNPLQFYQMDKVPRGKALIINNIEYNVPEKPHLTKRTGAGKDEGAIRALFEWMHFETKVFRDQTARQMEELASHYSSNEMHEGSQAFVCALMGHGLCGQLFGIDGELVSIPQFIEIIAGCSQLVNRPKMFFVEACQAAEEDLASSTNSLVTDQADQGNPNQLSQRIIPCAADCLLSIATLPEKQAFRDTANGALYIQHLCKVFKEKANAMHVDELLQLVNKEVKEEITRRLPHDGVVPHQVPLYETTLDKKVALKQPAARC